MTHMHEVERINKAIAAPPKPYHALIEVERNLASRHPVLYAIVLIASGMIVGTLI